MAKFSHINTLLMYAFHDIHTALRSNNPSIGTCNVAVS